MDTAAAVLIALGFLASFTLSALFVEIAKEDAKIEGTATREMWSRDLEYWKSHNERPATRDGVTGQGSNRAGLGLGATPNHTRPLGIRK